MTAIVTPPADIWCKYSVFGLRMTPKAETEALVWGVHRNRQGNRRELLFLPLTKLTACFIRFMHVSYVTFSKNLLNIYQVK